MAYLIYNLLVTAVFVAMLPIVPLLGFMQRRFRTGLFQRFGVYPAGVRYQPKNARPLWIHAASVGEVMAAKRLIPELRRRFPQQTIVLSSFTSTGVAVAQQTPMADWVLLAPLDLPWIVRRALKRFDPSMLIVLETEIWPNLLREARRRGVPVLLLSARISPRALRRYAWFGWLFREVIRNFAAIGTQTSEDADRMVQLGAPRERIVVTGNLKRAMPPNTDPFSFQQSWLGSTQSKRLLVVGSSHRGEEEIVLDAFISMKTNFPDLQLVLAPRHPERFAEVEKLLRKRGLQYDKKSQLNGRITFKKDILFVDTIGDLLHFYSIGDVAFVGGSLIDSGGHNVLEPAAFGKPVVFGPYVTNFQAVANEMKSKGAAIQVGSSEELADEISALLRSPERRRSIGEKAYQIASDHRDVIEKTIALVCRYFTAQVPDRGKRQNENVH